MRFFFLIFMCFLCQTGTSAYAAAVIEKGESWAIDWSAQKLRFFGESKGEDDLRQAEKKAWQDGLRSLTEAGQELFLKLNEMRQESGSEAADSLKRVQKQLASHVSSINTVYYADGTVRVNLEVPLAKVFESSDLRFRQQVAMTPQSLHFTGVILDLNAAIKPRVHYRVVDETGQVLFSAADMAQASYYKNLTGRWLKKPNSSEVRDAVGANPVRLSAVPRQNGDLIVERSSWAEMASGHSALLVNGSIALIMP